MSVGIILNSMVRQRHPFWLLCCAICVCVMFVPVWSAELFCVGGDMQGEVLQEQGKSEQANDAAAQALKVKKVATTPMPRARH